MTTPLTKPLKRALSIGGRPFVLTLTASGLKLTEKGRRKGLELAWEALVSGDAALAVALNASLGQLRPASPRAAVAVPASSAPAARPKPGKPAHRARR